METPPAQSDAANAIQALANPRWRELLAILMDPDTRAPNREYLWLNSMLSDSEKNGKEASDLWVSAADGAHLIRIAMTLQFPEDQLNALEEPGASILAWFWTIKHPLFVEAIVASYDRASPRLRKSAFTLLACQRTEQSAQAIVDIVRSHGFPLVVDFRFFYEINAAPEFARILLPALLLHAGEEELGGVIDFINVAAEKGTLNTASLVPALPRVIEQIQRLAAAARRMQQDAGIGWLFEDDYRRTRMPLGALLDVLANIPEAPTELLENALTFKDPRLQRIAVLGLLTRGVEAQRNVFEEIAASHGERAGLFTALRARGRLDLFPVQFANFEAFAASEMVEWLSFPGELGREPEQIKLMATLTGTTPDGTRKWCLWRFEGDEKKFYAAVSGPYELDVPVGPVHGGDAFSNFEEWDSATPEEHLDSVRTTLSEWRIAHYTGEM